MREKTDSEQSPEKVFRWIQGVFADLGLLGSMISIEYEGSWYRVSCDETSFMVYRVNEHKLLRHHVPGWPVCLVNSDMIYEEPDSPHLGQDHCACGIELQRWIEIINEHCINNLSESLQE